MLTKKSNNKEIFDLEHAKSKNETCFSLSDNVAPTQFQIAGTVSEARNIF